MSYVNIWWECKTIIQYKELQYLCTTLVIGVPKQWLWSDTKKTPFILKHYFRSSVSTMEVGQLTHQLFRSWIIRPHCKRCKLLDMPGTELQTGVTSHWQVRVVRVCLWHYTFSSEPHRGKAPWVISGVNISWGSIWTHCGCWILCSAALMSVCEHF